MMSAEKLKFNPLIPQSWGKREAGGHPRPSAGRSCTSFSAASLKLII